jgi:hypothetical protein
MEHQECSQIHPVRWLRFTGAYAKILIMATTANLDDLLSRARTQPGVADVMRIYGASQHAMDAYGNIAPTARTYTTSGTNSTR